MKYIFNCIFGKIFQEDIYITDPAELLAKDFIASKYLTWIAVLESNIFDLFASNRATSTSPFAFIILLYAFLWATAADTNSLSISWEIPKSNIYGEFTFQEYFIDNNSPIFYNGLDLIFYVFGNFVPFL